MRSELWLEKAIRWISERRTSPRTPIAIWLAAGVFVTVSVLAVIAFPYDPGSIRWMRLAWTAFLFVPAITILNGLEFYLGAQLLSLDATLTQSVRVGLYGSAANNLPVPGAAMVRVGALKGMGSPLKGAGFVTVATGILWVAAAAWLAGVFVWWGDSRIAGFALSILGAGLLLLASVYLFRTSRADRRRAIILGVVAVEVALAVTTALRFHVALSALGLNATAYQSTTLALAVVVGAALGIVPGGLGVRELVAGLLAPLVSIAAPVGLAATLLDRTVALVGLALLSVIFGSVQSMMGRRTLVND